MRFGSCFAAKDRRTDGKGELGTGPGVRLRLAVEREKTICHRTEGQAAGVLSSGSVEHSKQESHLGFALGRAKLRAEAAGGRALHSVSLRNSIV